MSSTRPKRNNSPINTKHQPLKATVPFQSLKNPVSPTSSRRRMSPCSPIIPPEKSRNRKSPDLNEQQPRVLLSPLAFNPITVKSQNSSLEALSSNYMNGQWPREQNNSNFMVPKGTQTVGNWEDPLSDDIIQLSLEQKRLSLANTVSTTSTSGGSKEVFRHHLKRTKQQSAQPCHSKQSCLQGDHSAVVSLPYNVTSKPVSIPQAHQAPSSPKYPNLQTRRSVEGLDFELEGLDLARKGYVFAQTPPEGRRPPVPGLSGKNFDTQTQTGNGWVDTFAPTIEKPDEKRSHSLSPSWLCPEKENTSPNRCLSADITMAELDTITNNKHISSNLPKYSASPKPNNSFWFARGPPDGAEKVPLNTDDGNIDHEALKNCTSCPDTSKVTIQFSKDSPFCSFIDPLKMKAP